jgi:hypothetical protein
MLVDIAPGWDVLSCKLACRALTKSHICCWSVDTRILNIEPFC